MARLASFVSPAILDDEPDVHFLSISLAGPPEVAGRRSPARDDR